MTSCARPNCANTARPTKRGLCAKHYDRYQRRGYTPAPPVREHIVALRSRGWGLRELAEATDLTQAGLCWILGEKSPQVLVETAERICAIPVPTRVVARGGQVDSCGTIRRLQGLALAGWPQYAVADMIGIDRQVLSRGMRQATVLASTAAAVADVADRLQHQRGPSHRLVVLAANRCWQPLLAWDENTIDDPKAQPSQRGLQGSFTDRYRDARTVHSDPDRIAAVLGITRDSLDRQLARHRKVLAS